jgi:hypothetical protein
MTENLFDSIGNDWDQQKKEAQQERKMHHSLATEILGQSFPIYKAIEKNISGSDIQPRCIRGNSMWLPQSPETVLQQALQHGETLYDLAWKHSGYSWPGSPLISWTTSREVAQHWAETIEGERKKESVIIETTGEVIPLELETIESIDPNFVIYIPVLARLRNSWPQEQCKKEFEAITFGVFPRDQYAKVTD